MVPHTPRFDAGLLLGGAGGVRLRGGGGVGGQRRRLGLGRKRVVGYFR